MNPQLVLLSGTAGDNEGRHSVSVEVLQAIERYNLLRTDQNGRIQLSRNGEKMWVQAEKK
jgi:beta-lactamase superfamily II metal-dependent hydrolase